jgi:acyl-CoA thioester hydrolase
MVVAKTAMFDVADPRRGNRAIGRHLRESNANAGGPSRRAGARTRSSPASSSAVSERAEPIDTVSIKTVENFDFFHRERVRFRDVDAMGHVNNAVFATYVEQARIEYLRHLTLLDGPLYMGMILARLEIDFVAPAQPGGEIEIGVRPSRAGSKSFELEYELRQGEREVARARTVLVAYDYDRGVSMPLPDQWRDRLAALA